MKNGLVKWFALIITAATAIVIVASAFGRMAAEVQTLQAHDTNQDKQISAMQQKQCEILDTVHAIDKRTVRFEERQGAMMRAIEELKEQKQ